MIVGSTGFFFLHDMVVNSFSLFSAAAVICAAQVRLSVVGVCGHGVAGVRSRWFGWGAEDYPLSGLLPVGLLGAGVVFCYWRIW
jgi:hypothetical protein